MTGPALSSPERTALMSLCLHVTFRPRPPSRSPPTSRSRPRHFLIVSEDKKGVRLEETELEPEFLELGRLVLDRIAPAERLFN